MRKKKIIAVDLVSHEPFRDRIAQVMERVAAIIDTLPKEDSNLWELMQIWSQPALPEPFMVKYNDDSLRETVQFVLDGNASLLGISSYEMGKKDVNWRNQRLKIRINCDRNPALHDYGYSISMDFAGDLANAVLSGHLVEQVERLAKLIHADAGRIAFNPYDMGGGLEYSDVMTLSDQQGLMPDQCQLTHLLPGVFWWTLIAGNRLDRLGGKESVMAHAPCYRVRDLSDADWYALSLQLSENAMEDNEEAEMALRRYVKSLLPKVNPCALAYMMKQKKMSENRIRILTTPQERELAQEWAMRSYEELRSEIVKAQQKKDESDR